MFDVSKIREQFPILKREVNGRDLVYFDNGASTQKLQSVIDTVSNYYKEENSNVLEIRTPTLPLTALSLIT